MNERYKELAREAGLLVYNPEGVPTKLEKFAELIVAECLSIGEDVANADGKGPWFEGYISGEEEVNRRIKQHFGLPL